MNEKAKELQNRLVNFALKIIEGTNELTNKREFVISNQIRKSGTSIGANYYEACSAQSKADFIAKASICLKEASETKYWLILLERSNLMPQIFIEECIPQEIQEIEKIFASIIISARQNSK
jgi:four helix bundle protein